MTGEVLGALASIGDADRLAALRQVTKGRVYDLDPGRSKGMPAWGGHVRFENILYRSPWGERAVGPGPDGPDVATTRWVSEVTISSQHAGAHVDALAHITTGTPDQWYGGFTVEQHLSDFGPLHGDAASMPPIILSALLLDAPALLGRPHLVTGEAIDAETVRKWYQALPDGIPKSGHVAVMIRSGLGQFWHEPDKAQTVEGAGVDLQAARFLVDEVGAVFLASDTGQFEQTPSADPSSWAPVHRYLLNQRGIHMGEYFYLEDLARDGVITCTLIVLPLRIHGATASMVRPIALV
jgi:kynurenine formamidase